METFAYYVITHQARKTIESQDWYQTLEDVCEDDYIVFSKQYEQRHRFEYPNEIHKVVQTEKKIHFKYNKISNLFKDIPILNKIFLPEISLKVWMVVLPVCDNSTEERQTFLGNGEQVTIPKNAKNLYFNSNMDNQFVILDDIEL